MQLLRDGTCHCLGIYCHILVTEAQDFTAQGFELPWSGILRDAT
jgi:hypothetical protein